MLESVPLLMIVHIQTKFASRYLIALRRFTFSLSANDLLELIVWLFAVPTHVVNKQVEENGYETDTFIDAGFDNIVYLTVDVVSSSPFLTARKAVRFLWNLLRCGFVEVGSPHLCITPQYIGATLERIFCEMILSLRASEIETVVALFMGRQLNIQGEMTTTEPSIGTWRMNTAFEDHHTHSGWTLWHVFARGGLAAPSDLSAHLYQGAFFLNGTKGLFMRLFTLRFKDTVRGKRDPLRGKAARIIEVCAKVFFAKVRQNLLLCLLGVSTGHQVAMYTRLLCRRLLEEVRDPQCSDHSFLQELLRTLRSLVVKERMAHCIALGLSISTILSNMLHRVTTTAGAGGDEGKQRLIPLMKPDVRPVLISPTFLPEDQLSRSGDINRHHSEKHLVQNAVAEGCNLSNGTTPNPIAKPFIPLLPLGVLSSLQFCTHNGNMTDARLEGASCSAVVTKPVLAPSRLKIIQKQPELEDSNSLHTSSTAEANSLVPFDDPSTLAELLLLLCCLLLSREGGMISQSTLVTPHRHTQRKLKWSQHKNTCAKVSSVYVLRKMEEFTHHPANRVSTQIFAEVIKKEMQTTNPFWVGVDVLWRLLLPQPHLIEKITIKRRIGGGTYGAVFSATHSCDSIHVCQHEWCKGDVTPRSLALKMMPVTRVDMEDECLTLVSCHTESTALRRLQGHSRLCEFLFCGCTASHYVLGMRLYNGGSLREWRVTKSGFPVAETPDKFCLDFVKEKHADLIKLLLVNNILSVCGPIFAQVLEAVEFMHTHHIRHNDIKADNILIESFSVETVRPVQLPEEEGGWGELHMGQTQRGEFFVPTAIRLCDFGVCEVVGEDTVAARPVTAAAASGGKTYWWSSVKGTEAVQAPETFLLRNTPPKCKVRHSGTNASTISSLFNLSDTERIARELSADIWACGCLLYELLTGVMLFGGVNFSRLLSLVVVVQSGEHSDKEVLEPHQKLILDLIDCDVTQFVLRLLAINPAERPTASAAREEWGHIMRKQKK